VSISLIVQQELLVKWTGRSEADTTWEQLEDFKEQLPRGELVDELFAGEVGNVVDSFIGSKYQRRSKKEGQQRQDGNRHQSGYDRQSNKS
jgi:hypothetical protein